MAEMCLKMPHELVKMALWGSISLSVNCFNRLHPFTWHFNTYFIQMLGIQTKWGPRCKNITAYCFSRRVPLIRLGCSWKFLTWTQKYPKKHWQVLFQISNWSCVCDSDSIKCSKESSCTLGKTKGRSLSDKNLQHKVTNNIWQLIKLNTPL